MPTRIAPPIRHFWHNNHYRKFSSMKKPMYSRLAFAALMCACATAEAAPVPTLSGALPLVIAHRGASGYLPEESVQAYQLAIRMGADYIEGDVYLTADKQAVMLHDGTLNATTNVVAYAATHPEIAALRSTNGSYDVTKFTLAQLQQLSVTCRNASGYCTDRTYFDPATSYSFATYSNFLDLAYNNFLNTGLAIGVFPEAKQSGLAVAAAILTGLHDPKYNGYFTTAGRALTQSFDADQVAYLNTNSSIPVSYLGVCPTTAAAAAQVAAIADGVGPSSSQLNAACINAAHDAGLTVMPYTYLNNPASYATAYNLGVDGVFTNFPDIAASARDQLFGPANPVPEPHSLALIGLGLAGIAALKKRRQA
jgi:glycerophosphoryl diester phosphodiesterase